MLLIPDLGPIFLSTAVVNKDKVNDYESTVQQAFHRSAQDLHTLRKKYFFLLDH